MDNPWLWALAIGVIAVSLAILARATLKGGRMLGSFMAQRDQDPSQRLP